MDDGFAHDDQHAFNMSIAMLFRIDKVLTSIAMAKLQGDIKTWYAGVFALKGEIYYSLKTEEREEVDVLFKNLAPLINESNRRDKLGGISQNSILIHTLEDTETILKEFMSKRGMLAVTKKDPRFALSGGM